MYLCIYEYLLIHKIKYTHTNIDSYMDVKVLRKLKTCLFFSFILPFPLSLFLTLYDQWVFIIVLCDRDAIKIESFLFLLLQERKTIIVNKKVSNECENLEKNPKSVGKNEIETRGETWNEQKTKTSN